MVAASVSFRFGQLEEVSKGVIAGLLQFRLIGSRHDEAEVVGGALERGLANQVLDLGDSVPEDNDRLIGVDDRLAGRRRRTTARCRRIQRAGPSMSGCQGQTKPNAHGHGKHSAKGRKDRCRFEQETTEGTEECKSLFPLFAPVQLFWERCPPGIKTDTKTTAFIPWRRELGCARHDGRARSWRRSPRVLSVGKPRARVIQSRLIGDRHNARRTRLASFVAALYNCHSLRSGFSLPGE